MKKNRNDKNISKSGSRFKSKFEFLKKLPHSVLSNSAVEKARAFFRSSELKHHDSSNSNDQSSSPSSSSSSSNQQHTTVNTLCSSFNSTDIDENTENNNTSLDLVAPKIYFSTSNMVKVDKINSKDMMNHQIIHNDQNDYKLSSKQYQNKYKHYSKPSLLIPKQYYNDILNKRNQYRFTSVNKYDSCPRSSPSPLSRNLTYSTRLHSPYNYLTPCNEASSYDQLPISLYNYRSYARHEIKSSLDETYIRPSFSIIQPLSSSSSSSSMLTWNQCVRRLNTEYKLTIIALQQAKERLEQVYLNPKKSISKYANLVTRDIKNLSNNERKKPTNVTFCLPSSSSSSSSSISIRQIEKNKNFPSTFLSKPKFIKPVELNTFFSSSSSSSSSKLEPVLTIVESNEKLDSVDTIIRKFNDLNGSLSATKVASSTIIPNNHTLSTKINDNTTNLGVYIKPSIINNDLKEIPDLSLLPSSSSKSLLINEKHQLENSLHEEETTYTIKTFYQSTNTNENNSSSNHQHVVIVEENTTEEKFNLAGEKQHQEIETNCTSPQHIITIDEPKLPSLYISSPQSSSRNENFPSIEMSSNCLINNTSSNSDTSSTLSNSHNKTSISFIPLKNNNNKPILQTSKRPTTTSTTKANIPHLGQSSKIIVSSTRLRPPSSKFINSTNTSIIRKPTKNTTNKIQSQSSSITKQQSSINSSQINESQNKTNSTSSIDKNRVKSIVNQINANTSSHAIVPSSKTNKRTHCSVSNQLTTSTSKNIIQRK